MFCELPWTQLYVAAAPVDADVVSSRLVFCIFQLLFNALSGESDVK